MSRVPPGTLRVIQPRAPFRIPLVMQHPLHGGHDTLPLHGDPWSAMSDPLEKSCAWVQAYLEDSATPRHARLVVKEKLEKPSHRTF